MTPSAIPPIRGTGVSFPFPVLTALFALLLLATTGCDPATDPGHGHNGANGNGSGGGEVPSDEIWMSASAFQPADREVEVGTTITWINTSSVMHTVTSGPIDDHDGLFDSGNMNPQDEFEYTFDEPGEFPYFCRPHAAQQMAGTITVVDPDE